jgi:prepilin-type N-terminal cleavage/methylation domain-containing protein
MLARIRKAMDENEQGFTLIELLVVMIIIGILAAIAIPVFLNQRKNAVDASVKSDLRTVANEMESYFTDQEVYPGSATQASAGAAVSLAGGSAIRVSKNTLVHINLNAAAATATAYCLVGDPSGKGTHPWVYESDNGGLQPPATTSCPGAYGTNLL